MMQVGYFANLAAMRQVYWFASYQIRSPLDLQLFRSDLDLSAVESSLKARYRDPQLARKISTLLEQHKKNLHQLQQTNKRINALQRSIKESKRAPSLHSQPAKHQQEEEMIARLKQEKDQQRQKEKDLKQLGVEIEGYVMQVGNIVGREVPISKDEANNQVIREYVPPGGSLSKRNLAYSDIMEQYGMTDLRRGQKVGGHRGYFLTGNGMKLALGLTSYAINFLEDQGYRMYQSPAIIAEEVLRSSCQLQTIQQDVYKLEGTQSYLIATSEQSLAGYYKDEVLLRSEFPIRMGGYSTCFRKEAGAHGKDIHGLFRVHQFEKVEQFVIAEAKDSYEEMKRMMEVSEKFYSSLGLPYRVVNIVSGELNDAAAQKLDLQAWYPSQGRFRQLVSVSNCLDYQSRLLKVQARDKDNGVSYPHMLNGTLVAVQRAITCIVENYLREDHIEIPQPLQHYVGVAKFSKPNDKKKNVM